MTDTTGELAELASARLPARSAALVVVDMQEFFCRPGSNFQQFVAVFDPEGTDWYADRVTNLVIPTIATLADQARAAGVPVLYTRFGHALLGS
jgi:nicotinamidase-related amidase